MSPVALGHGEKSSSLMAKVVSQDLFSILFWQVIYNLPLLFLQHWRVPLWNKRSLTKDTHFLQTPPKHRAKPPRSLRKSSEISLPCSWGTFQPSPSLTIFLNLASWASRKQMSFKRENTTATCSCGSLALEELNSGGGAGIHKGVQKAASPSEVLALPRGC